MALLFLFMSLIATALREIIENFMKSRSKDLERGIIEIFRDIGENPAAKVKSFYEHPLVYSLFKGDYKPGGKDLPSYIPRKSFSLALLDILAKASENGSPLSIDKLQATLAESKTPNGVQRVVLVAIGTAKGDLDTVRGTLEDWYDGTMDRVSGWYTRRTGRILGLIGLAAAILFNVDAVTVAQHLLLDKNLRAAVVAQAEETVQQGGNPLGDATGTPTPAPAASTTPANAIKANLRDIDTLQGKLADIGFPMGWVVYDHWIYPKPQTCTGEIQSDKTVTYRCESGLGWLTALVGWPITALAIMLGAPFWFDVLNKFMVIRSTIKPNEKSPDEASSDPQPATDDNKNAKPSASRDAAPQDAGNASDALELTNASAAAAIAAAGPDFVPHEWANDADPQRGVM